jgi:hypothetical protein
MHTVTKFWYLTWRSAYKYHVCIFWPWQIYLQTEYDHFFLFQALHMLCWLPVVTSYILTLAWSPNLHSLRTLVSLLLRLPFVWLLFRIARYVFVALLAHTLEVRSEASHEYVSPWPRCLQNNFSVQIKMFVLPDASECKLICIHVVRGIDDTNINDCIKILLFISFIVYWATLLAVQVI